MNIRNDRKKKAVRNYKSAEQRDRSSKRGRKGSKVTLFLN